MKFHCVLAQLKNKKITQISIIIMHSQNVFEMLENWDFFPFIRIVPAFKEDAL